MVPAALGTWQSGLSLTRGLLNPKTGPSLAGPLVDQDTFGDSEEMVRFETSFLQGTDRTDRGLIDS